MKLSTVCSNPLKTLEYLSGKYTLRQTLASMDTLACGILFLSRPYESGAVHITSTNSSCFKSRSVASGSQQEKDVHECMNVKLSSGRRVRESNLWDFFFFFPRHTSSARRSKKILNESRVLQERECLARRQMLEEERRRREEVEKRLQDETFHRQQLVEKEVKMRAKNFSQVSEMRRN